MVLRAEHFLPSRTTILDNLPVTAKGIQKKINDKLEHYMYADTHSLHHRYLSPRIKLVCTYFIYYDNILSVYNFACLLSHCK